MTGMHWTEQDDLEHGVAAVAPPRRRRQGSKSRPAAHARPAKKDYPHAGGTPRGELNRRQQELLAALGPEPQRLRDVTPAGVTSSQAGNDILKLSQRGLVAKSAGGWRLA